MKLKTLRSLLIDFAIFILPLILLFKIFPLLLEILSPFITAFFLYLAANPLNKALKKRNVPPLISALFSLVLMSFISFLVLRWIFFKLFSEAASLVERLSLFGESFSDITEGVTKFIEDSAFPPSLKKISVSFLPSLFHVLRIKLSDFVSGAGAFLIDFVKNLPGMIIWLFTTVFTTFFFLKEEEGIIHLLQTFFGVNFCKTLTRIKSSFFSVLISYLKAQLLIELIVFSVVFTGFLILGAEYAFLLALLTAVVDAVPVLGTGTVLVPLAIFNFFTGNSSFAWGLLIIYGIAMAARQLCEPKILGNKLGIHPLFTVFALYSGMKLFGIPGLIFAPLIAVFIKTLVTYKRNDSAV